ncbi:MAG TPA: DUF1848 domain-containing protein [Alphaproteobacteria bacterium]|mgnify:CR=1 FL=1|nr:DUF1848 domain-containing protein [Alphaproteobacteria bacterium]
MTNSKKQIISVSRRTDIPAYYGDWFMKRMETGSVGYINPFGGRKYSLSLQKDNVLFFVFWSKNYEPFLDHLDKLDYMGYKFYFQFTITGLPNIFEPNVIEWRQAVDTAQKLSERYSPEHVLWRFDPIVFSSISPPEMIFEQFQRILKAIHGATKRCYFSYVIHYGKVQRNFEKLYDTNRISFFVDENEKAKLKIRQGITDKAFICNIEHGQKKDFALRLAKESANYGIDLYTCCGDYLINDKAPYIYKARCIDGDLIGKLLNQPADMLKINPTRKECGCFDSRDIGVYDTCPHGCCYCYANVNKKTAEKNYTELIKNKGCYALLSNADESEFPMIPPQQRELF